MKVEEDVIMENKHEMLLNAYSADKFKKEAQKIIDLIVGELENIQSDHFQKTIEIGRASCRERV